MWNQKTRLTTVKDSFNPLIGLFEFIETPVWGNRYAPEDLTFDFLMTYGEKPVAPSVLYFKQEGQPLDEQHVHYLINLIARKKQVPWEQKAKVLDIVYKIEDNYNMVETENIDRETFEENLRTLLNSKEANATEVKNLLANAKQAVIRDVLKSGKDTVRADGTTAVQGRDEADQTTSQSQRGEDVLSFRNRKDVESRQNEKGFTQRDIDNIKDSTTLSFQNRKDSQRINNTETARDDTTLREQNDNTQNNNTTNGVFGLGSTNASDATQVDMDGNEQNVKTGNSTNERSANTNGTNDTTKTGSEVTYQDALNTKDVSGGENESGLNTSEKQGSELNATFSNIDGTVKNVNVNTVDQTDINNQETIYGSKDSETADNTSENTSNEQSTLTQQDIENIRDEANQTGNESLIRTLTRSGNIGVTTVTKMLQEHIEFWQYDFISDVLQDVKDELTLPIYQGGR